MTEVDILIVGGGVGGVAAALAAAEAGRTVLLAERHPWIGGQLTSQAVPPDEHPWIETHGSTASYRRFRAGVREHYRRWYPLTAAARADPLLNPGRGWVSPLCHEPRAALAVLTAMLAPHEAGGRLRVLTGCAPVAAHTDGDRLTAVTLEGGDGPFTVAASFVLEASETGELLALAGAEHRTGRESAAQTGEPNAAPAAAPAAMQAATWCVALDHTTGDHTIDRPDGYGTWRASRPPGWPGPLLGLTYPNPRTLRPVTARFTPGAAAAHHDHAGAVADPELWSYRRVLSRDQLRPGALDGDITIVNWPMTDYFEGNLFGGPDDARHHRAARELARSMVYWLQTEAPRPDGGTGHPALRPRPDVTGTADGLAQAPYIREARRVEAVTTVVEHDLSVAARGDHGAVRYRDTVGTGSYRIDLHPTTEGDPYLDVASHPFEIPLGALLPRRITNLIAAGKTIGTTHITNGCYRVHPAEWSIGEAAGALAAHCLDEGLTPHQVQAGDARLHDFQAHLARRGSDLRWPDGARLP